MKEANPHRHTNTHARAHTHRTNIKREHENGLNSEQFPSALPSMA